MFTSDYLGVLILIALGLAVGVGALSLAAFFGAKRYYPNKLSPYECGIPSTGADNQRFSVKFYLVAVSFILFDIETVFLIPWALELNPAIHSGLGWGHFLVGFVFLAILTLGLVYEWRKGLLDWNK